MHTIQSTTAEQSSCPAGKGSHTNNVAKSTVLWGAVLLPNFANYSVGPNVTTSVPPAPLPLKKMDGKWIPAALAMTVTVHYPDAAGADVYYISGSLSSSGLLTVTQNEQDTAATPPSTLQNHVVSRESLDLETGAYTMTINQNSDQLVVYSDGTSCQNGTQFNQRRSAILPISLVPSSAGLSLSLTNPYAQLIVSRQAPTLITSDQARNAPAALMLAADGRSTAVINYRSASNSPVTFKIGTALGSLGAYHADFLTTTGAAGGGATLSNLALTKRPGSAAEYRRWPSSLLPMLLRVLR